jgi:acyl transferase domain-containing protein
MYLGLARGHFLSSTGGCKPFDTSADGYCRGEGCVVFVLKRLSDAVAEGDRIHGVIREVVVNQSGNAHSITHPHTGTQVDLYRQLLEKTSISAESIDVVEAHGTGTQVCLKPPSLETWTIFANSSRPVTPARSLVWTVFLADNTPKAALW